MQYPDKHIVKFIKRHHVLTLATSIGEKPWCCNCFYAYLENEAAFVFTSDYDTRHVKELTKNPVAAGSVVLETKIIGKIKGIQFTGYIKLAENNMLSIARKAYIKRFPFAIITDNIIWIFYIEHLKMTDNKFGFGKKIIWERNK